MCAPPSILIFFSLISLVNRGSCLFLSLYILFFLQMSILNHLCAVSISRGILLLACLAGFGCAHMMLVCRFVSR